MLGLDILCAYDASVEIRCQKMRLSEKEVSFGAWERGPVLLAY
jgi:hypothetical protein